MLLKPRVFRNVLKTTYLESRTGLLGLTLMSLKLWESCQYIVAKPLAVTLVAANFRKFPTKIRWQGFDDIQTS